MFTFNDLNVRLIAAPMAGGPSTPELVAAAADVGGLGFLAAGGRSADALASDIASTRAISDLPFGVNLFVPDVRPVPEDVARYRSSLAPWADRLGVELGQPQPDDDDWDAKMALLEAAPVPVVSFTFGLPPLEAIDRLHRVGTCVVASVASVVDALLAAERGVDAVVIQGQEAGGHRAVMEASDTPNRLSAHDMLPRLRDLRLPVIAAGGMATGHDIAEVLELGAVGVQLGTALLLTPEAGTSDAHRTALRSPDFTATVVTRAFTGRPARSLANEFAQREDAPSSYPAVHQVTLPLRLAAARAGDLQHTHLWAGTRWRHAVQAPARDVLWGLWEETIRAHQGG